MCGVSLQSGNSRTVSCHRNDTTQCCQHNDTEGQCVVQQMSAVRHCVAGGRVEGTLQFSWHYANIWFTDQADWRGETSPMCDVHLFRNGSRGDLVSTATALRSGSQLQFRYSSRFLYSPKRPDRLWGPPNRLVYWYSFISIQPWRPGLAGTRAQSCDRYGSSTLHPGQVLGSSLPLLSTAFRRSHFSRQVSPPSATTRDILAAKGGTVGEKDVR